MQLKLSSGLANLLRTKKVDKISATFSGTSSWTAWPACGKICIWNFPCIWPTVRSLSNLSTPANSKSFDAETDRNFELKPSNQLFQWGSDLQRSTLQVNEDFFSSWLSSCGYLNLSSLGYSSVSCELE